MGPRAGDLESLRLQAGQLLAKVLTVIVMLMSVLKLKMCLKFKSGHTPGGCDRKQVSNIGTQKSDAANPKASGTKTSFCGRAAFDTPTIVA